MATNVILSSFTFKISDLSLFGSVYALSEEAFRHCDQEHQQQSDCIKYGDPCCQIIQRYHMDGDILRQPLYSYTSY